MTAELPDPPRAVVAAWPPAELPDRIALVDLATRFYRLAGQQDNAIRDTYHIDPVRFWQQVNRVIADPEVMAVRPVQCRVLREWREARHRRRGLRRR